MFRPTANTSTWVRARARSTGTFSASINRRELTQIQGSPFTLINDAISVFAHPSGNFVYFAQYFAPTGVVGLSRDSASGALSLLAGSPYAAGAAPGFISGDVFGRFVYVANSGDATGTAAISGFTVNTTTGELVAAGLSPFSIAVAGSNP